MNAEWNVPFTLETPAGSLALNSDLGGYVFQLVPKLCSTTLPVRITDDDVPQGDGKVPHRRWRSGYGVHLAVALLKPGVDAGCLDGSLLVDALDLLGLHINSMIRSSLFPGAPNTRLSWTPTGHDDRMFDHLTLAGDPSLDIASADALGGALVQFDMDTAHPYYLSVLETDTEIADGATETVTNGGNTDYFPAVLAYGPFDAFTLVTDVVDGAGNPLQLVYDADLPGGASVVGGDYIEFSFFKQTAYLNGNSANRKAGIDMRYSDFYPLVFGANALTATFFGGGGGTKFVVKSNDAFA